MYFDDLKVDIGPEDFNMDEDSDIQVRDFLLCGEVDDENTTITELTAEAYVKTRNGEDFYLGELSFTDLVNNSKEFDFVRTLF